ncbi:MAG: transglutaminase-like domain-containing protein [Candidatus Bathyarchaeota archaeon]|nr:transglutaminase-like domain-containing protein [Candidatus Bathyarchaeota archaeon]
MSKGILKLCDECGIELKILQDTGEPYCPNCKTVFSKDILKSKAEISTEEEIKVTHCHKCGSKKTINQTLCIKCGAGLQSKIPIVKESKSPSHYKFAGAMLAMLIIAAMVGHSMLSENQISKPETPLVTHPLPTVENTTEIISKGKIPSPTPEISQEPLNEDVREYALYALDWFSEKYSEEKYASIDDEVYKTTAIFCYVYKNVEYVADPHDYSYCQSPSETLRLQKGDCEDQALLMAAMCESVGLDSILSFVDTDQDNEKDHALCATYYPKTPQEFIDNQLEIWASFNIYFEEYQILSINEPFMIYIRSEDNWTLRNKYNQGTWVILENWEHCTSLDAIDVEYLDFTSSEKLKGVIKTINYGVRPIIGFEWNYYWSGKFNEPMAVNLTVFNNGTTAARDVIVWAGLYSSPNKVYDQRQTNAFNLEAGKQVEVRIYLEVPMKVNTRVWIKLSGMNFEHLETYDDWFQT